jgi:phosphoribosylaminoimidazolecarboxamide formyltransferase/IMP cyclohydrolase
VIKHTNPCGCAVAADLATAFDRALAGDPLSAFGSIVACNQTVDEAAAVSMAREGTFLEAVVAPAFDEAALTRLRSAKWGKSVRLLAVGSIGRTEPRPRVRPLDGGFLVQEPDPRITADQGWRVVTRRSPTAAEQAALRFAMRVAKHVKSNAIVLVQGTELVGAGAGQMSRVDAVEHAVRKAGERACGACLASDAFFPFADGLEVAAAAGVTACIQPGGSKNDGSVIAAADRATVAMVFTGRRHFRH